VGALVLAAAALAALLIASRHEVWSFGAPGAGLMPVLAAVILLVTSLLSLLERRQPAEGEAYDNRRVAWYGAGLLVLGPAILAVGMLAALGLFVLIMLRLAEHARWRTAALVAGLSVAASWLLFVRLLSVPLPGPAW
jgi:hypothetical protein